MRGPGGVWERCRCPRHYVTVQICGVIRGSDCVEVRPGGRSADQRPHVEGRGPVELVVSDVAGQADKASSAEPALAAAHDAVADLARQMGKTEMDLWDIPVEYWSRPWHQ